MQGEGHEQDDVRWEQTFSSRISLNGGKKNKVNFKVKEQKQNDDAQLPLLS
jgi:hypothetical protein